MNDYMSLLVAARDAWMSAAEFRSQRQRHKNYTYGDQWSDLLIDDKGKIEREVVIAARSGRRPLTNNMIRQIVKTVVGRYRAVCDEQGVYRGSNPLGLSVRELAELDCRMLEEFLISGAAIQRVDIDTATAGTRLPVLTNVDPRMFFVNSFKDPLGRDIELIGMLHDMTFPAIASRFGGGDPALCRRLASIFAATTGDAAFAAPESLGSASDGSLDFYRAPSGKCRLIEVWTLDVRRRLLAHDRDRATVYTVPPGCAAPSGADSRCRIETVWRCRWFAPDGTVIADYDSPYAHRSHPFAVRLYPLTDGEVHSFVEDVIDQQRYINRLIVMIDHMMAGSAKGVLLFPQSQLPKNLTWDQVTDIWARCDGLLPIRGEGPLPTQVVTPTSNNGAYELLSLQMKLFDTISGVGDALAGRNVSPQTGKELYESQIRNSTIAIADMLETFAALRDERDRKVKYCI